MKTITLWNDGWRFAKCPDGPADPAAVLDGEPVSLPHTWYADDDYYQGDAVYQKTFTLTPAPGQRAIVRFNVSANCVLLTAPPRGTSTA